MACSGRAWKLLVSSYICCLIHPLHLVKGAGTAPSGGRTRLRQGSGSLLLEQSEAWTHAWLPSTEDQCQDQPPTQHPAVNATGVCLPGRDRAHWTQSHYIFSFNEGPKHRFFICSHSPWARAKGRWYRLESPGESLEWGVRGEM